VADETSFNTFVEAVERVVSEMHSSTAFWTEPLLLARRAVNIG